MSDVGVFGTIVEVAGALSAAAAAISLAWRKRSRWQPPEEVVPAAVSRFSSLVSMVFIGLIFVFGNRIGLIPLASVTVVLLLVAIFALLRTMDLNIRFAGDYNAQGEQRRVLGGDEYTKEANGI